MSHKTGPMGGPWVPLERPRPPRVADRYAYWTSPPPDVSERCRYWLRQIERGWRPNRRLRRECYDCAAGWYGVWIWEFNNLIQPAMVPRRWVTGLPVDD